MLGSVSEWVWDGYGVPTDDAQVNPLGATAVQRVIRGGSYRTTRDHIRLAFRSMALPSATRAPAFHDGIGFRLARTDHERTWDVPPDVPEQAVQDPVDPEVDACRPVRRYVKEVRITGVASGTGDICPSIPS